MEYVVGCADNVRYYQRSVMSERSPAVTTMRFGVVLGIVGAALTILGPFIIRNFGMGDPWASTAQLWGIAPVGMAVTTVYSLLVQLCVPFSAALVGAALVMRHNERSRKAGSSAQGQTSSS